ncbi:MAG: hypothetical protein IKB16_16525, partial [Lentisphaeria bacterium]|nr:hypothetical protein [Lentisphaeria bacterium]
SETPSTRWLSLCEFKGLIPRVTLRSPWALLYRAVGTGFRFISAFTDKLVLCAPSDFFKSVFQFSSIFCSVQAQTVEEPFFSPLLLPERYRFLFFVVPSQNAMFLLIFAIQKTGNVCYFKSNQIQSVLIKSFCKRQKNNII